MQKIRQRTLKPKIFLKPQTGKEEKAQRIEATKKRCSLLNKKKKINQNQQKGTCRAKRAFKAITKAKNTIFEDLQPKHEKQSKIPKNIARAKKEMSMEKQTIPPLSHSLDISPATTNRPLKDPPPPQSFEHPPKKP
ncbi:Uncharacterized protein TCM_019214 [Theobroma cacao]|uniref:Uncharacterized protein n=1 Tax=Theobroma cacao TaxID=3641 RepID=A0A061EHT5_THECC|nr:Uncharacterized protein TCM_019214 [Theobroma cacao]